jgi:hypothetical protein
MGFLKEKSKYRPTRVEKIFAWVVTAGAAIALLWHILGSIRANEPLAVAVPTAALEVSKAAPVAAVDESSS